jgi:hypothetical protein
MALTEQIGIRALLWTGPTVPTPPPAVVTQSLTKIEITNNAEGQDGFDLTFALGKDSVSEFGLLSSGAIDTFNRVTVAVILGVIPTVLIDGIITETHVNTSDQPGASTLTARGKDVSVMMDLEEQNKSFPNLADFIIFSQIIGNYSQYGLLPMPFPTQDFPLELQRTPRQAETDYAFIQRLAQRNGFIFYVEPVVFGVNTAYFGPNTRVGLPQSPLKIDMGEATNLSSLNFSNNSAAPVNAQGSFIEPLSMSTIDIPSLPSLNLPPLGATPIEARRKIRLRQAANLDASMAMASSAAAVSRAPDGLTARGTIDATRYKNVLRARKLVGIAGAGMTHDGFYYVKQVKHVIQPHGSYTQEFEATRNETGALLPTVGPST